MTTHRFDPADLLRLRSSREDKLIVQLVEELWSLSHRGALPPSNLSYLVGALAEERGIAMAGTIGDLVPFDPAFHLASYPISRGTMVRVAHPGVTRTVDGVVTKINPILVTTETNAPEFLAIDAARAEEARKAEEAKRAAWDRARAEEASRWKRYD